jgi:hypothetical protein
MPPTPKPPGQRRRRNLDQPKWKHLPAEGNQAPAPELPGDDWLGSTLEWWATIWASPMATVWVDADVDGLARLACLRDAFARGDAAVSALPSIQALEDRYGLNPKGRRMLQWEIARSEDQAAAAPKSSGQVRRLRAVDPRAA